MGADQDVSLSEVIAEDSRRLWELRNHRDVRRYFFNSDEVAWENHEKWFAGKINNQDVKFFTAKIKNETVGVIRFDKDGTGFNVSVTVDPEHWGRGLGAKIIKAGTELVFYQTDAEYVLADIIKENNASRRAFEKAGYKFFKEKESFYIYKICAE